MKIAILDDEIYSCKRIKDLIVKNSIINSFDIDIYINPIEFIKHKDKYDLLFLDIDIPDLDGITLARQIEKDNVVIVFITAHKRMMIEAFGINVAGFIVKDNLEQQFADKLKRVVEMVEHKKTVTININNHIYNYHPDEIVYIEYTKKHIIIYLIKGNDDIGYCSINEINSMLPKQFVLVNKNQIINIKHVRNMKKNIITLKYCDEKIEVSRRKKDLVFNLIMKAVECL